MSDPRVPRSYRILLRAYPRSFRERFGPEMAQLFLDRRREGANGVGLVLHEAVDVLRVAPRLRLESSMSRTLVLVLTVATVAAAVLGGGLGLIAAALLAGGLVVTIALGRRADRPLVDELPARWWAWFVASAAAALVLFVVLAVDGDELTSVGWTIAFLSGNGALVLAVIGIANGALVLWQRGRKASVA